MRERYFFRNADRNPEGVDDKTKQLEKSFCLFDQVIYISNNICIQIAFSPISLLTIMTLKPKHLKASHQSNGVLLIYCE